MKEKLSCDFSGKTASPSELKNKKQKKKQGMFNSENYTHKDAPAYCFLT